MLNPGLQRIITGRIAVFHDLNLATLHVDHCATTHWIVMGDNDGEIGEYWAVTPADAQRLERVGYEILPKLELSSLHF